MENAIELDRWELSDGERELILKKSTINRLGFALLFKYFAVFGRFPTSLAEIGADVVQHVAAQLELDARLSDSPQDRTAERYRAEIRAFFGFREARAQMPRNWRLGCAITPWARTVIASILPPRSKSSAGADRSSRRFLTVWSASCVPQCTDTKSASAPRSMPSSRPSPALST
jgi:hypothetical protein